MDQGSDTPDTPTSGTDPGSRGGRTPGPNPASPYTDPETGFLRNQLDASSHEEIDLAAAQFLAERVEVIEQGRVPCTGDRVHLQTIHQLIFDGVFEWAGQFRKTDIDKQGTDFTPAMQVDEAVDALFAELAAEDLLRGLPRPTFVHRLAYYYAALNHIHPFREGNGRTQRLFWSQVALNAGWYLDWDKMSKADNTEASRAASQDGDLEPLAALIDGITRYSPSAEEGAKDLRKKVQRKQRWRGLLRWLNLHANPERLS